jgi:hypothetical protein
MADPKFENIKPGDRVRIIFPGSFTERTGRIVELRGPHGPGGMQVYRILLRKKPKRVYIEVREDQLEMIPQE